VEMLDVIEGFSQSKRQLFYDIPEEQIEHQESWIPLPLS